MRPNRVILASVATVAALALTACGGGGDNNPLSTGSAPAAPSDTIVVGSANFPENVILADIYASHGEAVAVSDAALMAACRDLARLEGIFAAPEGGAGLAAIQALLEAGKIARGESVVLFNTGSGYKYLEAWQAALPQ